MDIKEETIAILKQFDIGNKLSYLPVLPKASVLIPLFVKNGELYTLMTLRSKELKTSAGEVCFPGGKRDPSDRDDVDTALREAEEEIGLSPEGVQVVCRLFPIINKSGLLVTPVVGFIEESFYPCPNPAEVSAVFTVPLDFFTSEKDHCTAHGAAGMVGPLHSFHFVDPDSGSQYHIWGLTAMLAILVAALALRKQPEFDVGFDSEDPLSFFQQILHRRISKL
ncbi:peroxisomal coenzyme A diphosphatase NUDT7 [Seriola aureovittata]|uniref:peroxisomal coenzyme A diphosphatase NUDT7 n=1 Tax=Seriola aureovittata TaxID=2871759 RepID=UPI0024BD9E56|nr:peroxisomal coenzyme A diphosphatase NUDT7 [Seriola aureovittata]XP_056242883.1 peroxisomal coenzyme A diphosphatase NUDT7 [Seriola aureovittata]XP_056242884.1 peroxisomal coenzyme A diphosphatase NUDT7 [Seriola aureovittata]